jgi:hypothetical protein
MTEGGGDEADFEAIVGYDGTTFQFDQGYHAIFEIRKTDGPNEGPHPYRYGFTLHAPSGKRIMGFDNAHPVGRKAGKFKRRSDRADHWHRDASDKGRPYKFETIVKLLDDFLEEVERTLQGLGVPTGAVDVRRDDDDN